MFVVIDVLLHLLQWPRHAIADAGVPESSSPRAKQLMGYRKLNVIWHVKLAAVGGAELLVKTLNHHGLTTYGN